jgi:indole-3-glycerol phosphate synthase
VSSSAPSADLLRTILAATRRGVEVRRALEPQNAVRRRAEARVDSAARFFDALNRPGFNVIAECKRRSPSRGVLRASYDAPAVARAYAAAGAAAISVLTEPTFFDGDLAHLEAVREVVETPLLRKDFIVCEYQVLEARAAGADAVLLIVAALTREELKTLMASAAELRLDALVEVHDERELETAIEAGARLVGVNNRNLRTLAVDVAASERLVQRIPAGVLAISESGLKSAGDLVRLAGLGYRAFLIGERFMIAADPGAALQQLLEAARAAGVRPC